MMILWENDDGALHWHFWWEDMIGDTDYRYTEAGCVKERRLEGNVKDTEKDSDWAVTGTKEYVDRELDWFSDSGWSLNNTVWVGLVLVYWDQVINLRLSDKL